MANKPKRPRGPNQLAKLIVDLSTGAMGEPSPLTPQGTKNPAAVALGRMGGLKGGKARAAKLSPERLSEIGKKGVAARAAKRATASSAQSSSSAPPPQRRQKKQRRAKIAVLED